MFETFHMVEYDKNCYNLLCVNIVDSRTLCSIVEYGLPLPFYLTTTCTVTVVPDDKLLWKPIARVVRMAILWPLSFQNPWTDFVEVCSVFISLSQVWPHMQIHIVLQHLQWFWWTHYMWHVLAAYKRPSCSEVVDGLWQSTRELMRLLPSWKSYPTKTFILRAWIWTF